MKIGKCALQGRWEIHEILTPNSQVTSLSRKCSPSWTFTVLFDCRGDGEQPAEVQLPLNQSLRQNLWVLHLFIYSAQWSTVVCTQNALLLIRNIIPCLWFGSNGMIRLSILMFSQHGFFWALSAYSLYLSQYIETQQFFSYVCTERPNLHHWCRQGSSQRESILQRSYNSEIQTPPHAHFSKSSGYCSETFEEWASLRWWWKL